MNTKEKAPTSAATLAEAAAGTTACKASIPMFDCTTAGADRQRKVSELLNRGRENAVPLRHLMAITGADGRSIREKIAAERLAGVPILSDNSTGYYLPGNEGERERFVRSMRHRAQEIERAAEAVERGEAH